MDEEESHRRWLQIECELDALEDRRVIVGEDRYRELLEALLQEQDDLEYEVGEEDARARSA